MRQTAKFDYYYGTQADAYSFYRIPKVLFTSEYFKGLSCEAKVLYGLMLDRMSLSIKNRWFDDEGRVYIMFSIDDVMEFLGCYKQKAVKLVHELDQEHGIGLIEKKRIGFGKANTFYVKNFILQDEPEPESEDNPQYFENRKSISSEIEIQEVLKSNYKKFENQTLIIIILVILIYARLNLINTKTNLIYLVRNTYCKTGIGKRWKTGQPTRISSWIISVFPPYVRSMDWNVPQGYWIFW